MGVKEIEKKLLDEPTINNIKVPSVHRYLIYKSFFDFVLALIGIIITFPILTLFCLLIKLESKGPAFYTQERVGIKGTKFYVIKLRSMYTNAEAKGAQWASKDDPRVTKIGKFIRQTRIDEIPQLINVLKGDMSIIGPRPERPFFTKQFENEIPGFINRLAVKPGLTGWAQVNGGYDITPKQKLEHDLFYINNLSFKIDLKIFLKTILVVFTGDGAR
ncbi:exopolysaccharide biosynthesis polyprenyl glycosylphosphotransferase [Strepomyces sp. STD 3.1]|nr:exopolysaccharide biosynthesis polyprenyl glycosylphosphotransferase [Streptomyces sp. STD 3.1]